MVTWSEDGYLDEICEGLKFIDKYNMNTYYIYGLQQPDRPHVRMSPSAPKILQDLFTSSGYILEIQTKSERYCSQCDEHHTAGSCCCASRRIANCSLCSDATIMVGLRKDIRRDINTARRLIKTIIFASEGKLIADPTSKLNLGKKVKKIKENSLV